MNNYSRYTFKAKRKDNGEWVCGDYCDCRKLDNTVQIRFWKDDYYYASYDVIPETLCQCTGLQDRDCEYIFENDIVELNNVEFRVDYSYGSFEFSHDCDIDKNCDDADYINPIDYKVDECKIIGNKFDKEEE